MRILSSKFRSFEQNFSDRRRYSNYFMGAAIHLPCSPAPQLRRHCRQLLPPWCQSQLRTWRNLLKDGRGKEHLEALWVKARSMHGYCVLKATTNWKWPKILNSADNHA